MADDFDAVVANAGSGGASFAMDEFQDESGDTRVMPFTCLVMPSGSGYARVSVSNPIQVTGPVCIKDGAGTALTSALRGSEQALSVQIVNASGGQVTSFGPGTEYTEGEVDATITGVAAMWEDSGNTLRAISTAYPLPISDAGGAITVDGTVTANAGSGTFAISAASLPLPTGAATAAKQPALGTAGSASADVISIQGIASMTAVKVDGSAVTQPVSMVGVAPVSDNGSSLTVDASDLDIRDLSKATDSVAAWTNTAKDGSGTAYLPIVDADGHLQIDVLSGASGGTQYTEGDTDATITGTAAMMEVAANTLQPIQGTMADGLLVNLGANNDVTVTGTVTANAGSGTFAVSAASLPLPSGAATSAKQPALGTAGTASSDVITVQGIASMTALKVDGSAVTQPVSGTVTANAGSGTFTVDTELPAAATLADATANPSTTTVAAMGMGYNGTTWDRLQVDASKYLKVNVAAALPAGTNAIGKLASNSGVTIGAVEIAASQTLATVTTVSTVTTCSTVTTLTGGGVAHDGADSGNPIKVGAKCSLTLSDDTIVANGDRTDATSDGDGALLVRQQFPLGDLISERITDTGGTSTAFSNFGATANTRSYVTAITVFNSSATDGYVDLRDGTGGSVLYTVPAPKGSGAVITLGGAPLFRTSANTALAYDVSGALSTIYLSISGFKSKV